MIRFIVSGLLAFSVFQTSAQFTLLTDELRGLRGGGMTYTEFDADGDLDLIMFGDDTLANIYSEFYRNTNAGFQATSIASFPSIKEGSVDWADYDNDGKMDVVVMGYSLENGSFIAFYEHKNVFHKLDLSLPDTAYRGAVKWGDYTNDGYQDLLVVGQNRSSESITRLYENRLDSFVVHNQEFEGVSFGDADWVDYDGDGLLDFMICGATGTAPNTGDEVTKLYKNTEGGFEEVFEGQFEGVSYSSIDWGDVDGDGDPDLLLTGLTKDNLAVTQLYRNNQIGFELLETTLPAVLEGFGKFGDMDNDGDLDILICGNKIGGAEKVFNVYENNDLNFSEVFSGPGLGQSSGGWGDFNGDGFLDIFATGQMENLGLHATIYQSDGDQMARGRVLNRLEAPSEIQVSQEGPDKIKIDWSPVNDPYVTYAVQIEKEGSIVLSGLSNAEGSGLLTGHGNAGTVPFFFATLSESGTYTVKVQSVDQTFHRSAFVEQQFDFELTALSTVLQTEEEVKVYPNPVSDWLQVLRPERFNGYTIFDLSGRMMKSDLLNAKIDVSDLEDGTYYLYLTGANSITFRFVIESQ